MRRIRSWAVPAMFAAFAVPAAANAVSTIGDASAHIDAKSALIALYFALRAGVGIAFAILTCGRAEPQRRSRGPLPWIVCAVALLSVPPIDGPNHGTATLLVLIGDTVAVLGSAWLLFSVLTLGRCFGVLPEARGLVVRGPYRLVRHPVYLGEITMLIGLAVGAPGAWNLAALVLFVSAQTVRMRMEEAALTEAFPAYADYAAKTGRLLPRVRSRRPAARVGNGVAPTNVAA